MPPKTRVAMLLVGNLRTDARVIKMARLLQRTGHEVHVYWLDPHGSGCDTGDTAIDLAGARSHRVHLPVPLGYFLAPRARRGATPSVPSPDRPLGVLRQVRAVVGSIVLGLLVAHGAVRNPADIIHANDLDTLPGAVLLKSLWRAALVYDSHELYPDQSTPSLPLLSGCWRVVERLCLRAVTSVVTVNDAIAGELAIRYRLRQAPHVVMNCPEIQDAPSGPARDTPITVLYHGGLSPHRGLEALVAALPHCESRLHLLFRGAGSLEKALRHLASDLGVGDRVHFAPMVAPDDLILSMAGCAVGIVPYPATCLNNYLCSPNKLFEYMMGGLAVIGSDVPVVRSILEDTGAGVVCSFSSPETIAATLTMVTSSKSAMGRLRENARRAAERAYNWDHQGARLVQVYGALDRSTRTRGGRE